MIFASSLRAFLLTLDTLQHRYKTELRWQFEVPDQPDLTFQLWIEVIREGRADALPPLDKV